MRKETPTLSNDFLSVRVPSATAHSVCIMPAAAYELVMAWSGGPHVSPSGTALSVSALRKRLAVDVPEAASREKMRPGDTVAS